MSLLRFFRRARWNRERSEEIDSYIQIETDENVARGMRLSEARAAAQRKFGNSTFVREEIYRMNTIVLLDTLIRDVRYGWRMLRHNPTFTIVALLTLGIGIGANTAVFSVVDSVMIKPLPYRQAGELVSVWHKAPGAAGLADVSGDLRLSLSMFVTYAEQNRVFQSMGVWATGTMNVTGGPEPEQVRTVFVSDGALQALGVQPVLGRWLLAADQTPRGAATVMLGYGFWQRRFGADKSIVGRSITVDSRERQVVGVMPRGFHFVDTDLDLIVPIAFDRRELSLPGFGYQCVARLPRSRQNLARGRLRVCVPGVTPWATQLSRIFSIASTIVGCWKSPPEAANSERGKLGPGHGLFEQLGRLDTRKDNALGARVERSRNQRVLHVGDANDGSKPDVIRDAANVLDSLNSEPAVLRIDESPLEAALDENAGNILRSKCSEAAARLHLAFGKRLFHQVDLR